MVCGDDEDSSRERRPKFVDLKPIKGVDTDLLYIYIYIYKLLMGVADERTMRVDSAGSLLGCSRPLTSQLCQRLWWMVIGDDERWWSWDGGDLLEFYLFFISFK